MNFARALRSLAPIAKRTTQVLKAKSPTILVTVGLVSGVASTVMAIIRTPKCEQVREQFDASVEKANSCLESGVVEVENPKTKTIETIKYTNDIFKKDLLSIHIRKYIGYLRVYAPSIALGSLSVASILVSHGIMCRRNTALTAAVASVSEAFRRYRENIKREYGDEVDYKMRHSLVSEKVKTQEIDPETGKQKTVTKTLVKKRDDDIPWRSDYARCYEPGCRNWVRDSSVNRVTLMSFQALANQKLRSQGYLYLNEVYDMLGIDQTLAGHTMGWIYTKEENPHGDNFIDFGFEKAWDFMSGVEASVWLDFNVDDLPITDRIKWRIK